MDALLTIRQVTEATGVPAATLRAWERRYGFPVPHRTAGGHRRYSADDIERLARATTLVAQGWNAGSAVRQVINTGSRDDEAPVLTLAKPNVAPSVAPATMRDEDVDTEVLVLLTSTLRALLRLRTPDKAPALLIHVVETLGGEVVPADEAPADALPIDLSLGMGDPILPTAEAYTLARMRLESVLPALVEDAQIVVDRLRAQP